MATRSPCPPRPGPKRPREANKRTSRPLLAFLLRLALIHPLTDALQDAIWMPNRPIVGPKAFSTFVQQMRDAYPDLAYEVGQVRLLIDGATSRVVAVRCTFPRARGMS